MTQRSTCSKTVCQCVTLMQCHLHLKSEYQSCRFRQTNSLCHENRMNNFLYSIASMTINQQSARSTGKTESVHLQGRRTGTQSQVVARSSSMQSTQTSLRRRKINKRPRRMLVLLKRNLRRRKALKTSL